MAVVYISKKSLKSRQLLRSERLTNTARVMGKSRILAKRCQSRVPGGVRLCSLRDCCLHGQAEARQAEGRPAKPKGRCQRHAKLPARRCPRPSRQRSPRSRLPRQHPKGPCGGHAALPARGHEPHQSSTFASAAEGAIPEAKGQRCPRRRLAKAGQGHGRKGERPGSGVLGNLE